MNLQPIIQRLFTMIRHGPGVLKAGSPNDEVSVTLSDGLFTFAVTIRQPDGSSVFERLFHLKPTCCDGVPRIWMWAARPRARQNALYVTEFDDVAGWRTAEIYPATEAQCQALCDGAPGGCTNVPPLQWGPEDIIQGVEGISSTVLTLLAEVVSPDNVCDEITCALTPSNGLYMRPDWPGGESVWFKISDYTGDPAVNRSLARAALRDFVTLTLMFEPSDIISDVQKGVIVENEVSYWSVTDPTVLVMRGVITDCGAIEVDDDEVIPSFEQDGIMRRYRSSIGFRSSPFATNPGARWATISAPVKISEEEFDDMQGNQAFNHGTPGFIRRSTLGASINRDQNQQWLNFGISLANDVMEAARPGWRRALPEGSTVREWKEWLSATVLLVQVIEVKAYPWPQSFPLDASPCFDSRTWYNNVCPFGQPPDPFGPRCSCYGTGCISGGSPGGGNGNPFCERLLINTLEMHSAQKPIVEEEGEDGLCNYAITISVAVEISSPRRLRLTRRAPDGTAETLFEWAPSISIELFSTTVTTTGPDVPDSVISVGTFVLGEGIDAVINLGVDKAINVLFPIAGVMISQLVSISTNIEVDKECP